MIRLVPDASALVEYLLRTERAPAVERALREPGMTAAIPALCDVELSAVLRRSMLRGLLSITRLAEVIGDYIDLPLTRHGHLLLLPRILELRDNFSAYDATYVALAERLGATLLTCDRALARAVERHLDIEVIAA